MRDESGLPMAALGPWLLRRSRVVTILTTLGIVAVMAGGTMLAADVAGVSGAATTTKLSLTTKAAGATCNNTNPSDPICTGLAAGDVVNVVGSGFSAGSLASIEQCSSDPTQPQIFFLGNDVPVSCSPFAITNISSKGGLSGTRTLTTGTVGPPITGTAPTCTQTVPSTSVIKGCSTSGNAETDAAKFPCPPTATQQAAGDTCVLAIGDQAGDRAVGTILFGTETVPTSSTTSSTGSGSSTTGGSTSTTGSTTTTTGSTTTTTSPTSTATATQVSATGHAGPHGHGE
jgi:hypothetical protein